MGFYKIAAVESLGTLSYNGEAASITRTASAPSASHFLDGASKIDIKAVLADVHERFQISANPQDYLFEVIRANTAEIANANGDAFSRSELWRFDSRVGSVVYRTYEKKPHHLNHKADDASRARGVILASHYNEDAAPLDKCAQCCSPCGDPSQRDESGIHCGHCGAPVKDEFVEILIAIDRKKDPSLVRGIEQGLLRAGSMGCDCLSTTCNVCHKVAYSPKDFCEHIKPGSKGKMWSLSSGKPKIASKEEVESALRKVGWNVLKRRPDRIEIPELGLSFRAGIEFCNKVTFQEYSRVHRGADPDALSIEILKTASPTLSLSDETEQLLRLTALSQRKNASMKTQQYVAVRVNGSLNDLHIDRTLPLAVKKAEMGKRDTAEYTTVNAQSEGHAYELAKAAQYMPIESDVQLVVPDGVEVHMEESNKAPTPGESPLAPLPSDPPKSDGLANPSEPSIKDLNTPPGQGEPGADQSPEEFGLMPPGASVQAEEGGGEEGEEPEHKYAFAPIFKDLEIEVFKEGHAVIASPGGNVLKVKASTALKTEAEQTAFGQEVLKSIASEGLVRTAKAYNGVFSTRFANSLDGAMWPMKMTPDTSEGGALSGGEEAMKEQRKPGKTVQPHASLDGAENTFKNEKRPKPKSTIESRETDMEEEAEVASPSQKATDGADDVLRDKRPESKDKDTALDGPEFAAKVRQAEARLKRLYEVRMAAQKKAFEEQLEARDATAFERFARAYKIAAKRAALNLEESPLKATLFDSLTTERPVGKSASTGSQLLFDPLSDNLALHLLEAAWEKSAAEETEVLLARTAELIKLDDRYLVSAEGDLSKQAASVPYLSDESDVSGDGETQRRSAALRGAAKGGNLMIPSPSRDEGDSPDDYRTRTQVRAALSSTKVSRSQQEFLGN